MQETCGCKPHATSFIAPESAGGGTGSSPAAVIPGRPVVVEVYLLRCRLDGLLAYRSLSGQLTMSETPDEAAARIAGIAPGGLDLAVAVHWTSWRPLGDGSIILTCVVAPDPEPGTAAIPIASFGIAHGPGANRPPPPRVRREQVVAHAARHRCTRSQDSVISSGAAAAMAAQVVVTDRSPGRAATGSPPAALTRPVSGGKRRIDPLDHRDPGAGPSGHAGRDTLKSAWQPR